MQRPSDSSLNSKNTLNPENAQKAHRSKTSKPWLGASALLALSLLVVSLSLAQDATDSKKLQELNKELEQKRQTNEKQVEKLETLRKQIGMLSARQKRILRQVDRLSGDIEQRENELARVNARAAIAERQLNDIIAKYDLTQAKVKELKISVRRLLDATYRERSSQYLRLLTQASSFSDLLIRLDYANMSGEQTLGFIRLLKEQNAVLEMQRTERKQRTITFQDLQAQQVRQIDALKDKREEQEQYLVELRESEAGKRTLALRAGAAQAKTAQNVDALVEQVVQEQKRLELERKRKAEAERQARLAEAKRIAAEKERAKKEKERLEQERAAAQVAKEAEQKAAAERAKREAIAAKERARQAKQQAEIESAARAEEARRAREQAEANARARRAREAEEARQKEAALQARQEAIAKQEARLRQQQAAAALATKPLDPDSQSLLFPLPDGTIVENYGAQGAQWVVLSSPNGAQASAVAALDGDVVAATFYATLGWVVLLDNGKDVVTGYFGLQELHVKVGDRVLRGKPIGTIGGSYVFGADRMAFQIRRSEEPYNPQF